jgi:hypothetical protein
MDYDILDYYVYCSDLDPTEQDEARNDYINQEIQAIND